MTRLCRTFGVTRAGYYAWRQRPRSARAEQDRQLTARLTTLFTAHRGRYGSPRLHKTLAGEGWHVSRRRVARLMRAAGLRARAARVYRVTAAFQRYFAQYPNRLGRRPATRCNRVWVGDITYLPVAGQWHYLAVVMDQCSRRILAWSLARRRTGQLTQQVFEAARRRRAPRPGLIFHSDRGSEYLAAALGDRLRAAGARQSAAQRGPQDNAHIESFFHSLKAEVIHGTTFPSEAALRSALRRYIAYYNQRRLHSALGYQTPIDFEARAA